MERPILFLAPMVQAILNGTKTQTRRIIKPEPFLNKQYSSNDPKYKEWFSMNGSHNDCPDKWIQLAPYGKPGDILWVRETWSPIEFESGTHYRYKATFTENTGLHPKWKPSIHMPKVACRLRLMIKSIRVERLQDISIEDAKAEGIGRWIEERMRSKPEHYAIYYREPGDDSLYSSCPILSYETLWQKINGPDSWSKNPWVWVIEFKKL